MVASVKTRTEIMKRIEGWQRRHKINDRVVMELLDDLADVEGNRSVEETLVSLAQAWVLLKPSCYDQSKIDRYDQKLKEL